MLALPELHLVVVAGISQSHGEMVEQALKHDKHVIVEYPLALAVDQAEGLVKLARQRQRLLHIEHIELLSGQHQAVLAHLPLLGQPQYARYCTLAPQRPAPDKWTYRPALFGFPLVGALSRVHRLTSLFGSVERIFCQNQYDGKTHLLPPERCATCLCTAQLSFDSGLIAEVLYGKGEAIWSAARRLEIYGSGGSLLVEAETGQLTTAAGSQPIDLGPRRGLFAKDTAAVLDALLQDRPLYVRPEASLYALRVADAARQSALTGQAVVVDKQPDLGQ
jgi:biliverdin reductase